MDLKEFTKETLIQIVQGVEEVNFDVAVTASETDGTKGGGGIKVAQILHGGIETSKSTENQSISRVRFSLPLVLDDKKSDNFIYG